jgi:UDP-N-acetyl-D-mannosaminuronic acid dehydrogenase
VRICVIGLGYIGLPTATMLADHGNTVTGVDVNPHVVAILNRGDIHLEEPGLSELFRTVVRKGTFLARTEPAAADVFIVAVPTPNLNDEHHSCDLSYVLAATRSIVPCLRPGNTVIIESTVAPRSTSDEVKPVLAAAGFTIGEDLYLAHCPERVLPGHILTELVENNRIIGGITPACSEAAARVYRTFVKGELLLTEAKTAEMAKCMENTFRDVNIALANELAKVCVELDIDSLEVIRLANKHPRVNILQPGPGVGGHCLAVDPYFIYAKAPATAQMIKLARDINSGMPGYVAEQVKILLTGIENPVVAIFGAAYKGNTDDTRESPALEVIEHLRQQGCEVRIHDPHVHEAGFVSLDAAVTGAHIVVVLADHSEFRQLDHRHIAAQMARPLLFDLKGCVSQQENSGLTVVNYGNLSAFKPVNPDQAGEGRP